MNNKNKLPLFVSVIFCAITAVLALPFVIGPDGGNQQPQCLFANPANSVFSCHVRVPSDSIYPRLDFGSVPEFPCHDRKQALTACFFDELMAQAPVLIGRTSYIDFLSKYKPSKNIPSPKSKNMDLIAKLPREIGGDTIDSFNKSLKEVSTLVRRCIDAGQLDEAREVLKDAHVVVPDQMPHATIMQLKLYELFTILGLPEKADRYGQQVLGTEKVILDPLWYDVLVGQINVDREKAVSDFLSGYKTEAERGYQAAIIIRSLLKLDNDNFDLVSKLWPQAIGWCMQRNVDADIGRPVLGFYHDEYIPNTYPACVIQLLPNYRFPFSSRGH